jgi:membrane-bound lytic murein transglycosylase B
MVCGLLLTALSAGLLYLPAPAGAADSSLSTTSSILAGPTPTPGTTGALSPGGTASATTTSTNLVVNASDGVAPALANLPLTRPDASIPESVITQLLQDQRDAAAAQAAAEADLARLKDVAVVLSHRRQVDLGNIAAARQREQASRDTAADFAARAETVRQLLEELAMASYMGSGYESTGLSSSTITDASRRTSYSRNVADLKTAERRGYLAKQADALSAAADAARDAGRLEDQLKTVDGAVDQQRGAVADAERRRTDAIARQADVAAGLKAADQQLKGVRRTAKVVGLDFPLVVLDALWKATSTANAQYPACRLSWSLLAGISRIESGHGTSGGASVAASGDVTPHILGPVLDGKNFALILDTDHGVWDGDPVYDRAVGPMQFIPSSWLIYGQDGNGDGKADPNNYYDATLGAANHLCRGGADTSTDAGRRSAVLSYNQSEQYLATVVAYADGYAKFQIPPAPPTPAAAAPGTPPLAANAGAAAASAAGLGSPLAAIGAAPQAAGVVVSPAVPASPVMPR